MRLAHRNRDARSNVGRRQDGHADTFSRTMACSSSTVRVTSSLLMALGPHRNRGHQQFRGQTLGGQFQQPGVGSALYLTRLKKMPLGLSTQTCISSSLKTSATMAARGTDLNSPPGVP